MNTVRQLLKAKGTQICTISKNETVANAMQLMAEKRISSLVVTEAGKVVGIFTERDFARKIGPAGKDPALTKIETVMTKELITVGLNHTVNDCMTLMADHHIRHLPVMDGDDLVGIISVGDVVKDIIEELEFHVEQLTSYIKGFR